MEYQPPLTNEKTEGETLSQGHTAGAVIPSSFSWAYFVQLRVGSGGARVRGGGCGLVWGAWPQGPGINKASV